uniref:SCP domain-containing protein n=1 Tax=Picea sitchensis TaxID=3332 RepID=D5A8V4_PICSI|nr:unknown [Picea sitchensis]
MGELNLLFIVSIHVFLMSTAGWKLLGVTAAEAAMLDVTEAFLDAHNKERATLVGVPPLRWNNGIASYASRFARSQRDHDHCEMKQSGTGKYGENLLWGKGRPMTPSEAVQSWIDEKKFYDYKTNSCLQADQHCGVYTQVVWKNSTELGCALVSCDKGDITFVVCNYSPPGNIVGERPY